MIYVACFSVILVFAAFVRHRLITGDMPKKDSSTKH